MRSDHIVKSLDLMSRKEPPIATCPRCEVVEPLVFTFEHNGYEFICLRCGGWFGFLDPKPAEATPDLHALSDARKASYRAIRRALSR